MNSTVLRVKYECEAPSCQVFCKKGDMFLSEAQFEELTKSAGQENKIKSPDFSCRMGFTQVFNIVSVDDVTADAYNETQQWASDDTTEVSSKGAEMIRTLMDEHERVIILLDKFEKEVRTRDIEALWFTTCDLMNDIMRHSVKKEEGVLFPLFETKIPMGPGIVAIMKEDHREFLTILHGFRCGLQDGEMLDGLVSTVIVNLRNHIMKEDEEIFPMINELLSDDEKVELIARMKEVHDGYVTLEPGNRSEQGESVLAHNRKKMDALFASNKSKSAVGGEAMCCGSTTC